MQEARGVSADLLAERVAARGERPQIFGLRPDALRAVDHTAGLIERGEHAARLLFDAVLLREVERAFQPLVQRDGLECSMSAAFDQEIPFELMPRLQPVVRRADRQFGDAACRLVHEHARDPFGERGEACVVGGVARCFPRSEPCFREVHQRVLQRTFHGRGEVFCHDGVQHFPDMREPRFDELRRFIENGERARRTALARVVRARENDERVRVQVLCRSSGAPFASTL